MHLMTLGIEYFTIQYVGAIIVMINLLFIPK